MIFFAESSAEIQPFLRNLILTRTDVRVMMGIEQKFYNRRNQVMTGWTLFFTLLGVAVVTAQLFRIIDAIERPTHRTRRRALTP